MTLYIISPWNASREHHQRSFGSHRSRVAPLRAMGARNGKAMKAVLYPAVKTGAIYIGDIPWYTG
jgi:hypothetical protein